MMTMKIIPVLSKVSSGKYAGNGAGSSGSALSFTLLAPPVVSLGISNDVVILWPDRSSSKS